MSQWKLESVTTYDSTAVYELVFLKSKVCIAGQTLLQFRDNSLHFNTLPVPVLASYETNKSLTSIHLYIILPVLRTTYCT